MGSYRTHGLEWGGRLGGATCWGCDLGWVGWRVAGSDSHLCDLAECLVVNVPRGAQLVRVARLPVPRAVIERLPELDTERLQGEV